MKLALAVVGFALAVGVVGLGVGVGVILAPTVGGLILGTMAYCMRWSPCSRPEAINPFTTK